MFKLICCVFHAILSSMFGWTGYIRNWIDLSVCSCCCFTSQSTAMVITGWPFHLTTLLLGKLEQAVNQSFVHILSLLTDNKNSKWVWSGNTTITNRRQPRGTARKSCSTITRHQEDKLSKATSPLFPIKMIAILEWTKSNVQQNIEQLQTPTMGVTINKKSTTTEPPP